MRRKPTPARKPRVAPPIPFGIAVLAAASLVPGVLLLDAMRPAGDGASGVGNTLLFLLVALIVTAMGDVKGLRHKERFAWLGYVVLALWVLPLLAGDGGVIDVVGSEPRKS